MGDRCSRPLGCVAFVVTLLAGCGEEARRDLSEAGKSLGAAGNDLRDAAQKSAEQLEGQAEVASEKLGDQADAARGDLATLRDIADKAGDAYLDPDSTADRSRAAQSIRRSAETYEVDRTVVTNAAQNPIAMAGRSSFDLEEGGGLRVTAVDPASPVAALDVRPGDVLVSVDGTPLDQVDGPGLVERLGTTTELTATFERDGARVTKTIRIDEP